MSLIHPLLSSNIDVIGDVHGEIGALSTLLARLGYDGNGNHPENRKLVFVGDLVDRGPNSIAVFELVRRFVKQKNAQTILGNHELNLLVPDPDEPSRPKFKHGNYWFHGDPENMITKDKYQRKSWPIQFQRLAKKKDRQRIQKFFRKLPIALENEHIRIIHACWDTPSVENLRNDERTALEIYHYYKNGIAEKLAPLKQKLSNEDLSLQERNSIQQKIDLTSQNENPIKILTSGKEEASGKYYTGGKDRVTRRTKWWDKYNEEPYVVFGHYWRTLPPTADYKGQPIPEDLLQIGDKKNIPKIFDPSQPFSLLGPNQNCMCIDYSVGRRFWERHNHFPLGSTGTALGALRFRTKNGQLSLSLLFENGEEKDLTKT